MKHYESGTPRAAFALVAFAIAAITFALVVAAPAHIESGGQTTATTEARQEPAPTSMNVAQSHRQATPVARKHA
jgi:hypothetical protein